MELISKKEVAHLADLARLVLDENQKERLAGDLSKVVSYIEQMGEIKGIDSKQEEGASNLDLEGDIFAVGVTGLKNVLAEDEPRKLNDQCHIDHETLMKGAPSSESGYFKVRAVME